MKIIFVLLFLFLPPDLTYWKNLYCKKGTPLKATQSRKCNPLQRQIPIGLKVPTAGLPHEILTYLKPHILLPGFVWTGPLHSLWRGFKRMRFW